MMWLNNLLAEIGGTIVAVFIVITGVLQPFPEASQALPIATSTPEAIVTTIVQPDAVFEATKAPKTEVESSAVPPVIVIPVIVPKAPEPTTTTPLLVYNDPMPVEEACVEEVKITSFRVGLANANDAPRRGMTSTVFTFIFHGTAKCADTFDVEFSSNVPVHQDITKTVNGETGEATFTPVFGDEKYTAKGATTGIKTAEGFTINKSVQSGYILQPGTYEFKVKISKEGVEQAEATTTVTI